VGPYLYFEGIDNNNCARQHRLINGFIERLRRPLDQPAKDNFDHAAQLTHYITRWRIPDSPDVRCDKTYCVRKGKNNPRVKVFHHPLTGALIYTCPLYIPPRGPNRRSRLRVQGCRRRVISTTKSLTVGIETWSPVVISRGVGK
jgi:hypothetical protein